MLIKTFLANHNLFILMNLKWVELQYVPLWNLVEQKTHADINQIRLRIDLVKNQYLAAVHILLISSAWLLI